MAELRAAQSENLKGGCPGLGIGKHFISVLLEQRKTEQRITRVLIWPLLYLFCFTALTTVSVTTEWFPLGSSPLVAVDNTVQKTKQLEVLLGQRSRDPPSHRLICTLGRNYSHLGVCAQTCYSIHNFRAVPGLLVSTSDMKENWPLIFDHCFRRSRSD